MLQIDCDRRAPGRLVLLVPNPARLELCVVRRGLLHSARVRPDRDPARLARPRLALADLRLRPPRMLLLLLEGDLRRRDFSPSGHGGALTWLGIRVLEPKRRFLTPDGGADPVRGRDAGAASAATFLLRRGQCRNRACRAFGFAPEILI